MIHIICIKWGSKFSYEYVNKLFRSIKNNTSKEFLFTCFTEDVENLNDSIKTKPIPNFTGDWYSKISLYNKNLYNSADQIFYFDLDTVILRNLDNILEYSGKFIILRDFYHVDKYGSGLMSWQPEAVHHMWQTYLKYKKKLVLPRGDQGWCEQHYPNADIWQDEYPFQIASYKVHIRDKHKGGRRGQIIPMDKVSILCFHGNPLPHEVPEYWT